MPDDAPIAPQESRAPQPAPLPAGPRTTKPAVWLSLVLLGVVVAVALRISVLGSVLVVSESMLPTLQVGDHVAVNRLAYALRLPFVRTWTKTLGQPARGEVVIFAYPYDDDSMYVGRRLIKRVIAIGGDRVRMRDNVFWINGSAVAREGLKPSAGCGDEAGLRCEEALESAQNHRYHTWRRVPAYPRERIDGTSQPVNDANWPPGIFDPTRVKISARLYAPPQNRDYPEFVVPEGMLLLVGDNRDHSQDGRYFGLVPTDAVEGRAIVVWISRVPGDWLPAWHRFGARPSVSP